jgi:hypothetical protein
MEAELRSGKLSTSRFFLTTLELYPFCRERVAINKKLEHELESEEECIRRLQVAQGFVMKLIKWITTSQPDAKKLFVEIHQRMQELSPQSGFTSNQIRRLIGACKKVLSGQFDLAKSNMETFRTSHHRTCYARVIRHFGIGGDIQYWDVKLNIHKWDDLTKTQHVFDADPQERTAFSKRFDCVPGRKLPKFVTDCFYSISQEQWTSEDIQLPFKKWVLPMLHPDFTGNLSTHKDKWLQAISPFIPVGRVQFDWKTYKSKCRHCNFHVYIPPPPAQYPTDTNNDSYLDDDDDEEEEDYIHNFFDYY